MLRDLKKKSTRDNITRNAIEMFKEKGYDNVTVEEIAAACGIAKGTFFNYFPKKEHVLLHVADSYAGLMDDIVTRHPNGPLKERVLRILRDLLHIYTQHEEILRLTLIETIKAEIVSGHESTNISNFKHALRRLMEEAGEQDSQQRLTDPELSAGVIVGLFFQTLITLSSKMSEDDIYGTIARQLDAVWEGIGK
ncbi:TetR/AcrR family transcriptional regulator [Paenibacillus sp. XY044]|uniref:TetR/AcrR family transcriptional regulator n=1 Tax=Paenibacillus sp. XY044 TaxID=2026089 RepID=UPI0015C62207|nr:TetR/AcrR family transcriptional regulator [Paenibacillus sp. XY044]